MMPPQLPAMIWVETRTVFRRPSGLAALILALAVGVLMLAGMRIAESQLAEANINGVPLGQAIEMSALTCAGRALQLRNFFVLPILLLLATGGTFATELGDRTLREQLVRAVPRWSVLLAKAVALTCLAAATLVATLVPALLGGALVWGFEGDVGGVLLGYLVSLLSDLGLISMGLMLGTFVSSSGAVVVGIVLFLMADLAARAGLGLAGMAGVDGASELGQMLPGAALASWEMWSEGWRWEPLAGLLGLIALCLGVAAVRFSRTDLM